jgi:hypothetical protein
MKREDGGPAFPIERHLPDGNECYYGMSLRDYFAAAVIQGIIAWEGTGDTGEADAIQAYQYADAMLKARGQ